MTTYGAPNANAHAHTYPPPSHSSSSRGSPRTPPPLPLRPARPFSADAGTRPSFHEDRGVPSWWDGGSDPFNTDLKTPKASGKGLAETAPTGGSGAKSWWEDADNVERNFATLDERLLALQNGREFRKSTAVSFQEADSELPSYSEVINDTYRAQLSAKADRKTTELGSVFATNRQPQLSREEEEFDAIPVAGSPLQPLAITRQENVDAEFSDVDTDTEFSEQGSLNETPYQVAVIGPPPLSRQSNLEREGDLDVDAGEQLERLNRFDRPGPRKDIKVEGDETATVEDVMEEYIQPAIDSANNEDTPGRKALEEARTAARGVVESLVASTKG